MIRGQEDAGGTHPERSAAGCGSHVHQLSLSCGVATDSGRFPGGFKGAVASRRGRQLDMAKSPGNTGPYAGTGCPPEVTAPAEGGRVSPLPLPRCRATSGLVCAPVALAPARPLTRARRARPDGARILPSGQPPGRSGRPAAQQPPPAPAHR